MISSLVLPSDYAHFNSMKNGILSVKLEGHVALSYSEKIWSDLKATPLTLSVHPFFSGCGGLTLAVFQAPIRGNLLLPPQLDRENITKNSGKDQERSQTGCCREKKRLNLRKSTEFITNQNSNTTMRSKINLKKTFLPTPSHFPALSPLSIMGSLPQGSVLYELLQHESIPQATDFHKLLHLASFSMGCSSSGMPCPSVGPPQGHKSF